MSLKFTILAVTAIAGLTATAVNAPFLELAQVAFGQRCQTPQGVCIMGSPAPVNTQCFCPTPFGPVGGFVVQ
jgi:hypothetical protein